MRPLRGLYAITPLDLCRDPPRLLDAVAAALRGGAQVVQYRDKTDDHERRRSSCVALRALCEKHDALLIVNDDVELAAAAGAHGVHLGLDDLPLAAARARLGPAAVIGVTCADSAARARAASEGGANYVALGAFFATRNKLEAKHATLDLLRDVRTQVSLPICAIGGITAGNAGPIVGAGADLVAAVGAVFENGDVTSAARAFARCFG